MQCPSVTRSSSGDIILSSIFCLSSYLFSSIAHTYTANHSSARLFYNRQPLLTATTLFTPTTSIHPFSFSPSSFHKHLLYTDPSNTGFHALQSQNQHRNILHSSRASPYPLAGFSLALHSTTPQPNSTETC